MAPAIGSQSHMAINYYTRFRYQVKPPMTNSVIGAALPDGRPGSGNEAHLLSPVPGSSTPTPLCSTWFPGVLCWAWPRSCCGCCGRRFRGLLLAPPAGGDVWRWAAWDSFKLPYGIRAYLLSQYRDPVQDVALCLIAWNAAKSRLTNNRQRLSYRPSLGNCGSNGLYPLLN